MVRLNNKAIKTVTQAVAAITATITAAHVINSAADALNGAMQNSELLKNTTHALFNKVKNENENVKLQAVQNDKGAQLVLDKIQKHEKNIKNENTNNESISENAVDNDIVSNIVKEAETDSESANSVNINHLANTIPLPTKNTRVSFDPNNYKPYNEQYNNLPEKIDEIVDEITTTSPVAESVNNASQQLSMVENADNKKSVEPITEVENKQDDNIEEIPKASDELSVFISEESNEVPPKDNVSESDTDTVGTVITAELLNNDEEFKEETSLDALDKVLEENSSEMTNKNSEELKEETSLDVLDKLLEEKPVEEVVNNTVAASEVIENNNVTENTTNVEIIDVTVTRRIKFKDMNDTVIREDIEIPITKKVKVMSTGYPDLNDKAINFGDFIEPEISGYKVRTDLKDLTLYFDKFLQYEVIETVYYEKIKTEEVEIPNAIIENQAIINFLDKTGAPIKESITVKEADLDTVNLDIDGYVIDSNLQINKNFENGKAITNLIYQPIESRSDKSYNVIVKYIDETGKSIKDDGQINGKYTVIQNKLSNEEVLENNILHVTAPEISGFKIKNSERIELDVSKDNTVTFVYETKAEGVPAEGPKTEELPKEEPKAEELPKEEPHEVEIEDSDADINAQKPKNVAPEVVAPMYKFKDIANVARNVHKNYNVELAHERYDNYNSLNKNIDQDIIDRVSSLTAAYAANSKANIVANDVINQAKFDKLIELSDRYNARMVENINIFRAKIGRPLISVPKLSQTDKVNALLHTIASSHAGYHIQTKAKTELITSNSQGYYAENMLPKASVATINKELTPEAIADAFFRLILEEADDFESRTGMYGHLDIIASPTYKYMYGTLYVSSYGKSNLGSSVQYNYDITATDIFWK